jgi:hypothetical protein
VVGRSGAPMDYRGLLALPPAGVKLVVRKGLS